VAIARLLAEPGVIVIPKATQAAHVADNRKAADIELNISLRKEIDHEYPPPTRATPLAMN
jgi:diketogulonate reductase-like aldo/keto reductase